MKTIKNDLINLYEIKNSKFYTLLFNINNKDEALEFLKQAHITYPNATHYCYAYITDDYYHLSDDGEPSGTAGIPIYNVLKNNQFNNTLAIVIRYYGGIKLGAGGLVRAYTKSITESLKIAQTVELEPGLRIKIITDFKNIDNLNYLLKDNIINRTFEEKITIIADIFSDDLNKYLQYQPEILEKITKKKD